MEYKLPKLNYGYDALEPYIDRETMMTHHLKHHKGYTDKFNDTIKGYEELEGYTAEEIIANINTIVPSEIYDDVKKYGGGYVNHNLYFNILNPSRNLPTGKLKDEIENTFGSYDNLRKLLIKASLTVFGSGWAWLVVDSNCQLKIVTTKDQVSPLSYGFKPLINIDMWEHAYYLKHKNDRKEYLNSFFEVIDFDIINDMFSDYCENRLL